MPLGLLFSGLRVRLTPPGPAQGRITTIVVLQRLRALRANVLQATEAPARVTSGARLRCSTAFRARSLPFMCTPPGMHVLTPTGCGGKPCAHSALCSSNVLNTWLAAPRSIRRSRCSHFWAARGACRCLGACLWHQRVGDRCSAAKEHLIEGEHQCLMGPAPQALLLLSQLAEVCPQVPHVVEGTGLASVNTQSPET